MPNVYNQDDIPRYLAEIAGDDEELGQHLITCLGKALRKEGYWIEPINELPADAPDFMREKWHTNTRWHRFIPNTRLDGQVRHIADWIKAAMVNNEAWLEDIDDKGRPKILVQTGTMEQAINKANKAMAANRQKAGAINIGEDGINLRGEMELDNGFRIVRLFTPGALDLESQMLGHCIGDGAYDAKVKGSQCAYYSLRDKNEKSHATFEINTATMGLLQCKGKQDVPPIGKYMSYARQFIERKQYNLIGSASETGLIETGLIKEGGKYYDIYHLPENWEVLNLDLSGTKIKTLPNGLKVHALFLNGVSIDALPEDLEVEYLSLDTDQIRILSKGAKVGSLRLSGPAPIDTLPEGVKIRGKIYHDGAIIELPSASKNSKILSSAAISPEQERNAQREGCLPLAEALHHLGEVLHKAKLHLCDKHHFHIPLLHHRSKDGKSQDPPPR